MCAAPSGLSGTLLPMPQLRPTEESPFYIHLGLLYTYRTWKCLFIYIDALRKRNFYTYRTLYMYSPVRTYGRVRTNPGRHPCSYRGTSLIRNSTPLGPYSSPMVALGGGAVSYERGTPVHVRHLWYTSVNLGAKTIPGLSNW